MCYGFTRPLSADRRRKTGETARRDGYSCSQTPHVPASLVCKERCYEYLCCRRSDLRRRTVGPRSHGPAPPKSRVPGARRDHSMYHETSYSHELQAQSTNTNSVSSSTRRVWGHRCHRGRRRSERGADCRQSRKSRHSHGRGSRLPTQATQAQQSGTRRRWRTHFRVQHTCALNA